MRGFLALILFCCLVSCGNPKKTTLTGGLPADSIISRDQMVRIMVDLHLVEATLQLQRNKGKDTHLLTKEYYQWLYSRYHISRNRFMANLNYYKQDPENFGKIYELVLKELIHRSQKPPGSKK